MPIMLFSVWALKQKLLDHGATTMLKSYHWNFHKCGAIIDHVQNVEPTQFTL